jgi:hypothetical protein
MDAEEAGRIVADYYRDEPGVAAVYLFGSMARAPRARIVT